MPWILSKDFYAEFQWRMLFILSSALCLNLLLSMNGLWVHDSLLGPVKRNSITKFKSIISIYMSLSANVRASSSLKSITGLVDGRGENICKHSQKMLSSPLWYSCKPLSGWTGHWLSLKFFVWTSFPLVLTFIFSLEFVRYLLWNYSIPFQTDFTKGVSRIFTTLWH